MIAGVNRQQVASAEELVDILESVEGTLALLLQREGRGALVIIR